MTTKKPEKPPEPKWTRWCYAHDRLEKGPPWNPECAPYLSRSAERNGPRPKKYNGPMFVPMLPELRMLPPRSEAAFRPKLLFQLPKDAKPTDTDMAAIEAWVRRRLKK